MSNKEQFKNFVKNNPKLIEFVNNKEKTWQEFYEMYDLYGENFKGWNDYLKKEEKPTLNTATPILGLGEVFNWIKGLDLNNVQNGVNSLQRVVGVLQDFSKKDKDTGKKEETYKPRPLYKHFED